MGKVLVIINKDHEMKEEQKLLLENKFSNYELLEVPSEGWTYNEQINIARELEHYDGLSIVFISPVPVLLAELSFAAGYGVGGFDLGVGPSYMFIFVFSNDQRIKKELPSGKIISVIPDTGWELKLIQKRLIVREPQEGFLDKFNK